MTDTTQQNDQTQQGDTQDQTSTQDDGGKGTGKGTGKDHGTTKGPALQEQEQAAWNAGLPDDLKSEKTLQRHANLEDAMRALVGAEKRLGVPADQLVRLPTKPEESAELYRKLGAPETADGYQIGLPDNASDDDKAAAKSFAEHMHKSGPFPPDFVKAAVEWNNQQAEAASKALEDAQTARRAEGEALIKAELGQAYDPDMKAVGKLLHDLGGKELAEEFDASGMGDNPRLMIALQKIVNERGETQKLDGQGTGSGSRGGITPGQAAAALETLLGDPVRSKALFDNSHPMHKSILAEKTRLVKISEGLDPDD